MQRFVAMVMLGWSIPVMGILFYNSFHSLSKSLIKMNKSAHVAKHVSYHPNIFSHMGSLTSASFGHVMHFGNTVVTFCNQNPYDCVCIFAILLFGGYLIYSFVK